MFRRSCRPARRRRRRRPRHRRARLRLLRAARARPRRSCRRASASCSPTRATGDRLHPDPVPGRGRTSSAGWCRCRRCRRSSSAPTSCSHARRGDAAAVPRSPQRTSSAAAARRAAQRRRLRLRRRLRRRPTAAPATPPTWASRGGDDMGAAGGVVVEQASIGPYDYAVLKADDETAMLQWLDDNHYFVPAGTDGRGQALHPPGRATSSRSSCAAASRGRHHAGRAALRQSDLPMIPITLTRSAPSTNMGIQVWMLGEARAIPRNYYHVVARRPADLVRQLRATTTASSSTRCTRRRGKHGFITEYAGAERVVGGRARLRRAASATSTRCARCTTPSRLSRTTCATTASASTARCSRSCRATSPSRRRSSTAGRARRRSSISNYDYYTDADRAGTDADGGVATPFDPGALTDEIEQRIVTPTRGRRRAVPRPSVPDAHVHRAVAEGHDDRSGVQRRTPTCPTCRCCTRRR